MAIVPPFPSFVLSHICSLKIPQRKSMKNETNNDADIDHANPCSNGYDTYDTCKIKARRFAFAVDGKPKPMAN